jgi:hypothetical protein
VNDRGNHTDALAYTGGDEFETRVVAPLICPQSWVCASL